VREAQALARGMGRANWARVEVGQVDCGEKDWAGLVLGWGFGFLVLFFLSISPFLILIQTQAKRIQINFEFKL